VGKKRLGEVVDIISGGTPKTNIEEYWNGNIFWMSVRDFAGDIRRVYKAEKCITELGLNKSSTRMLEKNDIIISARGTVGEVAQIGVPMAFNQSCYGLRAKKNYSNDFIYYSLKYYLKLLKAISNGSVFDTIIIDTFYRIKIIVPPLPTQQKIADILSAYDDLIENNNRRIELLEKVAKNLYKEWFVRFRFPNYKETKFEKGLLQVWNVVKLGDVVEIIDGDRGSNYPKQEEFFDEGYCLFLNTSNVTQTGFNFSSNSFISKEKDGKLRKGKLQRNDIIMTTRGTVGNVALYSGFIKYNNIRINSGMVIIREIVEEIPIDFLYAVLRSENMKKSIMLYSSGSAQPQLPIKDMRKLKLILPSNDLINEYNNKVKNINLLISNIQTQNQNLIRQRDLQKQSKSVWKIIMQKS